LLVLGLSACAAGPNFERPAPPAAADYGDASRDVETASAPVTGGDAQHLFLGHDVPAQWWTLFGSAKLNGLVEQALKGNPGLDSARAALRQAHELYLAARATYYPTIQAGFDAQRARNALVTVANPTSLPQEDPYYNLYTAQLTVSYMPDVFGGTRRAVEAARALASGSRFQLDATYLALTANVVVTAITEAGLRTQIAATRRLLELQHQITEKVQRQMSLGTASHLDVLNQEAAEAQTAATLPPLEKQLEQSRDALTALLGRLPAEQPAETFELQELTLPAELPVSLPSRLVEQRPDVRQAEENLHYASAQAGVAIADMLPQFSINGNLGSTALSMSDLFRTGTGFWDIGASLTQTLFDAGALLHKHRAADAALDQAGAQYRATVILACQNVADTLRALKSDVDALRANADAARAARETFDLLQRQLDLGTVSLVQVLNVEQTYRQAELALAQTQANRYTDTAALFQALGGDWWHQSIAGSQ
jgi:NodT family efflux transporter outer membrane factor (OMF) lipoprotein